MWKPPHLLALLGAQDMPLCPEMSRLFVYYYFNAKVLIFGEIVVSKKNNGRCAVLSTVC